MDDVEFFEKEDKFSVTDEVLDTFGAWADREDITDDWVYNLRHGWSDRLDELYGEDQTA